MEDKQSQIDEINKSIDSLKLEIMQIKITAIKQTELIQSILKLLGDSTKNGR